MDHRRPPSDLRLMRLVKGLRLLDVSTETGIASSKLSLIERGEVKPSEHDLDALTRFYAGALQQQPH